MSMLMSMFMFMFTLLLCILDVALWLTAPFTATLQFSSEHDLPVSSSQLARVCKLKGFPTTVLAQGASLLLF